MITTMTDQPTTYCLSGTGARIIILFTIFVVAHFDVSLAQYSVAPNAFIVADPSRSTELYIKMSPDAAPMEFEMSSFFSVPGSDSSGNFKLFEMDSLKHRSASPYLRFSPRRFILQAGEHQLVRISVTTDTLHDGEYWARIMTSAKLIAQALPIDDHSMSAVMGLEIRTVSGFLYRKGDLSVEIGIRGLEAFVRNDSLFLDVDITKTGSAAWLGTADIEIGDTNGKTIYRTSLPTNAYVATVYRYVVPLIGIESGSYVTKVTLVSFRDDPLIPLIKAPSVSSIVPFEFQLSKAG